MLINLYSMRRLTPKAESKFYRVKCCVSDKIKCQLDFPKEHQEENQNVPFQSREKCKNFINA